MKRIERILTNADYLETRMQLDEAEKMRIYCRHGLNHSLDVARIMYIQCLEQGMNIDKELIYAAALIHDLGRAVEYTTGKPHHLASVNVAKTILAECGFSQEEQERICEMIGEHRNQQSQENWWVSMFYRADKLSRNCFACQAADTCKWPDEKRNTTITC